MKDKISVFWFRRDLRLSDNAGLYRALRENKTVLPVFIFDTDILNKLENTYDRRVDFIYRAVNALNEELKNHGSTLNVYHGSVIDFFAGITAKHDICCVYTNHDYEPYARERDNFVSEFLNSRGIEFKSYKDQCVFEKQEVEKSDGKPYTIFTPYSRQWKNKLTAFYYKAYPTEKYFRNLKKAAPAALPPLESLGFEKTDLSFNPALLPGEQLLLKYKDQRDYPAIEGTSRLSVYLRFGMISVRALVARALPLSETWLNELIWRDFYMMILWHFPHAANNSFKKEYDQIPWVNNEKHFEKWCSGHTGFPIVDAGIRELNATGFMHNRVRMIVSSFLVKDLLIDWRWGEAYFAAKLNDFDLSANNGGWQWAAGSGCDAAPYFRVFSPAEQQKKFDPEFKYIKKWVPEFGTKDYPTPIVDHAAARLKAIATYKKALSESRQTNLFETPGT
ncbi:MAG: deoxyribodipyrimidine photo-lyase [Bacteroidota bacterium]